MDMTPIDIIRRIAAYSAGTAYTSSAATVVMAIVPAASAATAAAVEPVMPLSDLALWVGIACSIITMLITTGSTIVFKWLEYRATLKARRQAQASGQDG